MARSQIPEPVTKVSELADAWLPARMARVEERLAQLVTGHGPELGEDAGLTLAAGGKRLRPLLVLLCAGPDAGPEVERAAAAIELVHMASLVHDDVLDAAPIRRGRPTVVARSGRRRAVATGDLLFSRAFAELSAPGAERQVAALARAAVALARGELAQRQDAFDVTISVERYLERCRLKTAALFECACVIGREGAPRAAGEGGEPGERAATLERLGAFGAEIGLAFQLLDDVLDVVGPPERTGKARGTDLLDGTVTLPFIHAREHDRRIARVDLRHLSSPGAEQLCDRIVATGAPDQVRGEAGRRVTAAKRNLADAGLADEEIELFELLADGVVERYS